VDLVINISVFFPTKNLVLFALQICRIIKIRPKVGCGLHSCNNRFFAFKACYIWATKNEKKLQQYCQVVPKIKAVKFLRETDKLYW